MNKSFVIPHTYGHLQAAHRCRIDEAIMCATRADLLDYPHSVRQRCQRLAPLEGMLDSFTQRKSVTVNLATP